MPSYPSNSDNDRTLWLKIANNFYDYALTSGSSGLNPPSWNDSIEDLMRKCAYYTATLS